VPKTVKLKKKELVECTLPVSHEKAWIRNRIDYNSWIQICIDFQSWIWIRIETNMDPKHCCKLI